MLSPKDLARIIRDELGEYMRNKEEVYYTDTYYILLDGRIILQSLVSGGEANDIYAELILDSFEDPCIFYFNNNYLVFLNDIVYDYIRKIGFTIFTIESKGEVVTPPAPNLKYYITAYAFHSGKSEYLDINVYDIDAVANSLGLPQLVQQELGDKPREIGIYFVEKIVYILTEKQPLLAGYTYKEALRILYKYYVRHKDEYKDEAFKIAFAYMNLFPEPYKVCYEWDSNDKAFIETNCLKLELLSFSS